MSSNRTTIVAPDVAAPIGPYCHAVRHGDVLYCTGQLPLPPAGGTLVDGGVREQALQCLRNLEAVCAAAGTELARALRVSIYMLDLAAFGDVNEVYKGFFGGEPPARTTIGVAGLPLGALIELDAIVAIA